VADQIKDLATGHLEAQHRAAVENQKLRDELARVKAQLDFTNGVVIEFNNKLQAAEARAERLREALERYLNNDNFVGPCKCERCEFARATLAAKPASPRLTPHGRIIMAREMLTAAAFAGHEGTLRLAAQLAGASPCPKCGFVKQHCRCEAEKPAETKGGGA